MVRRSTRIIICLSCISIFVSSVFLLEVNLLFQKSRNSVVTDVYVGIDATFSTVQDMKIVIDKVKSYTNFFIIGSTAITNDFSNITQVCEYLNKINLPFLTYAHPAAGLNFSQIRWFKDARNSYPFTFQGLYAYDEPGGHQIDHDYWFMCAQEASNHFDASITYVANLTKYLDGIKVGWETELFPLFVSDYALYEYDYRAGYDVVLTEFAWNQSRQLNVALCRGAAVMNGKDWGVMITGGKNDSTFQTGQEVFDDMVLAYQNGAKYILLFDYPNFGDGLLKQEHFDALRDFWHYIQKNPREKILSSDKIAYVLPKDYGYGFRGDTDKIWGLWEADSNSAKIWQDVLGLVQQYGFRLDIVYEDCVGIRESYNKLVFWNGTELDRFS
jgi:hypothetical protein